ncbi:hypothetical protein [Sphingomonas phyllosphaerae]|uniref:hypothetical protein n=1 Tax=Sphingomonas phyllosphaerae TaxID=257003 RepID=UPI0003B676B4|nr:hypothetical protein [Sphingomonas phyllosphaerae]
MIELAAVLAEIRAVEADGKELLTRHQQEFDALLLRQRAEARASRSRLSRLANLVEAG